MEEEKEPRYKEQPAWIAGLLYFYGMMWITMIIGTGLNSLLLGYIDYNSGSIALAMTIGFYPIIKFFER